MAEPAILAHNPAKCCKRQRTQELNLTISWLRLEVNENKAALTVHGFGSPCTKISTIRPAAEYPILQCLMAKMAVAVIGANHLYIAPELLLS